MINEEQCLSSLSCSLLLGGQVGMGDERDGNLLDYKSFEFVRFLIFSMCVTFDAIKVGFMA